VERVRGRLDHVLQRHTVSGLSSGRTCFWLSFYSRLPEHRVYGASPGTGGRLILFLARGFTFGLLPDGDKQWHRTGKR
jgi:hypothetical protein